MEKVSGKGQGLTFEIGWQVKCHCKGDLPSSI
jgi:hypothetical protein